MQVIQSQTATSQFGMLILYYWFSAVIMFGEA